MPTRIKNRTPIIDLSCSPPSGAAFPLVGIHDGAREFRIKAEGPVGLSEAREMEACWLTAASTIGSRRFVLDLYHVTAIHDGALPVLQRLAALSAVAGTDEILAQLEGKPTRKTARERCYSVLCHILRAVLAPVVCFFRRFRPAGTQGRQ